MENEFATYKQALALKELGFDEPCLGFYDGKENQQVYFNNKRDASGNYKPFTKHERLTWFGAPLKQQVFRWFRDTHGLSGWVNESFIGNERQGVISVKSEIGLKYIQSQQTTKVFEIYEEAEDACIDKLIEIVKENK